MTSHECTPVPVDLTLTGETVAHLCAECLEPCTPTGYHLASRIRNVREYR